MKNVLIITYYFSREEDIGSIRLRGLANYLRDFGWNPTIVTVKPANTKNANPTSMIPYQIIETNNKDIITDISQFFHINPDKLVIKSKKSKFNKNQTNFKYYLLKLVQEIFFYPDGRKWWYKYGLNAGIALLNKENYNALISSSSPVTSHLIAKELKMRSNIPWIADLRDLWTQNHYYPYSSLRKTIETKLEKKTLGSADALITVSQPLNEILRERYLNKRIFTITNGFDSREMNPGIPLKNCLNITYTGHLYRGRRDPEPLLKILNELIYNGILEERDVHLDFYGKPEYWLKENVNKYKLGNVASIHGLIPRKVAIKKQWESQILLLLNWNNPAEKGVYTGKLFDYLAARRPILSLGYTDGGVVKELLDQTQAGVHCSNEAELRDYLLKAYHEYKELGAVQYRGIEAEVMKYSHREMARKFAEVLERVAGGN